MICSGTPPPPYTPLSLHMRPAVSITLGESLRYGVPRPHVAAAVDAVVYTHAARWRNCPIFVVTHMPLTTKGFDHKTPIRTSFDQRFSRYSQLSPSIRAPTRNNNIRCSGLLASRTEGLVLGQWPALVCCSFTALLGQVAASNVSTPSALQHGGAGPARPGADDST